MSNWINHVKEYAKTKRISYSSALKDPETKSTYHAKKSESKAAINIEANDENKINIITDNKPHDKKFDELKTELKTRRKGRKMLSGMVNNIVI